MPETAQKYERPFLRACRKADVSWDGLPFLCISYAGDCSIVWVIFLSDWRKHDISWDGLQFLCISLCQSRLKSMSYEHAEQLILAERVFNFYASSCAEACCNSVLVFGCCLDPLVNTRSLFPLQITSVWTLVCKSILVHSAYWSPRSKCARGILRPISPRSYFVGGLSKKAFAGHSLTTHDNS